MTEQNEQIAVQNLTDNDVIYIDNDGGINRRIIFRGGQTIMLPKDMLERMRYDRGGERLITDYLSVKDDTIREEVGIPADQIEYDWEVKDVDDCLTNGSIDALKDALEFAPQAIRDLIIVRAVALPINDRQKAEVISEMTGRNIEAMITNKEAVEKQNGENGDTKSAGRRVANKPKTSGRRVKTDDVKTEEADSEQKEYYETGHCNSSSL